MTNAETIKKFTLEVESEMNKRGGKLFVCESDKYLAASAAASIVGKGAAVVVVHDSFVAGDWLETFGSSDAAVVPDRAFFADFLSGAASGDTDKEYSSCAKSFIKRYPKIIVPLFDNNGAPVFNGVLVDVMGVEGEYLGSTTRAKYCVSDFLAACGYDCVVVDGVYSAFEFARANKDETEKYAKAPHSCDCMSFMGEWYFTDIARSHSRLKKLCSSAKKCMLISDVIARRELIELYAAADVLRGEARVSDEIKHIDNYERNVESVCGYFSFEAAGDETTAMLLSAIDDSAQIKPDSQEKISEYLNTQFHYMTKYEMFAKILCAHAENKFDGKFDRLKELVNGVCRSDSAVDCFATMFFHDALKGTFESKFKEAHLCKFGDDDVAALLGIFDTIGFYESYRYDCDMLDTVRIMRDDSGYEAFVENHASFGEVESADVDETEFSVIGKGSDLLYECATCARLVTDNVAGKCSMPLLIVAKQPADRIVEIMTTLLPEVKCTSDFTAASSGKDGIIVTDFNRLAESARPLEVKTAVFFGMTADPQKMCSLINKTLGTGDTRGIILTRHGDLSGRISAKWNYVAERDHNFALPIGTDEIEYKPDKFASYDVVTDKINCVYVTLKATAVGECDDAATLASWLTTLETDYMSDGSQLRNNIAQKDFGYLAHIGKTYEKIFESSVSVGRKGERINVTGKYESTEAGSGKLLFNTCARFLSRSCNGIDVDCKTCPEREKFAANNFSDFCLGVDNFFAETKEYAHSRDIERQEELDERQIYGGGEHVKELTEKATDEADKRRCELMKKAYPDLDAFDNSVNLALDSDSIVDIRNTVAEVYALALERYHNRIVEVFDAVSEKVKVRFEELLRKQ